MIHKTYWEDFEIFPLIGVSLFKYNRTDISQEFFVFFPILLFPSVFIIVE